jgi:predicted MFS family arabinose efflux permease
MSARLTMLFAVAGAIAVGNLYYSQPLLHLLAADLHVDDGHTGLLVTATQGGYAIGVFLLVPLGDSRNRRTLIPLLMLLAATALACCAIAPTFVSLLVASAAVGVTTVAGQLITPLAGDLAGEQSRGRVVGIVVSGLITGILVARILSGVIADHWGWRAVFVLASVVNVAMAFALLRAIPHLAPKVPTKYPALLFSVFGLIAREATLRITMVLGAIGFAVFTMFWTAVTFLLSGPPYALPASGIGLLGIAGLIGALAAQGAGRLHDRGRNVATTGVLWLTALATWVGAGAGAGSLLVVIVAAVILDIAVQGLSILNQARIFGLSSDARSRVNTAYITANFIGGALGSLVAALLWPVGGWTAITIAGMIASTVGALLWLAGRRSALRPPVR